MTDLSFDHRAALDGVRTVAPLALPGLPFGLVLGFLIRDGGIDRLAGWSSSWMMLAGASQLAALNLIAEGASAVVIIGSVLLVNSRHVMYSAALRSTFAEYPAWFRFGAPYLLIDQVFAVASTATELEDSSLRYRMWHYLGAGALVWTIWQISVGLGIFLGDFVREEWSLEFAVPLLFIGLLGLSLSNRPSVVAAIVATVVAVAGREMPQGSSLLLAIILGVIAGGLAEAAAKRDSS